jgi:23S rRNA (guanosine2251-2'-O)-methyltransferase
MTNKLSIPLADQRLDDPVAAPDPASFEPTPAEAKSRLPVAVLLDNIRSMYNVGAFFRAADGVGLEKLCLCGITAHPPKNAITKTALGSELTVPWSHDWDATHAADSLRRAGFSLAAIETSPHAVDLFEWQPRFPVCVAFGNEVDGLHPDLLALADAHVRIPMHGQKNSLNVATAGGVVLYELLRKYRVLTGNAPSPR